MAEDLPDLARELLDRRAFLVLTTINPDGGPQSSVVWAKYDGSAVVFSTIRGRRKTRNMERDPRVSMCMYDPTNPYRYVELRGSVSIGEEGGDALIDELSRLYDGKPFVEKVPGVTRVVCTLSPDRVTVR